VRSLRGILVAAIMRGHSNLFSSTREADDMRGALQGIRVLDLTRVLAGPIATQTLADLGAEVIKIERPRTGDDTRGWGPPFIRDVQGRDTSDSAYFACCNRGKKSVTVDLSTEKGQALVRQLAQDSDVLAENYKAGDLARYGLDYAALANAQSAAGVLLDYGLWPNRSLQHQSGLRSDRAGDGRVDERDGRTRRRPGGRPATRGRGRYRRADRHVRRERNPCCSAEPREHGRGAIPSTWRCSTYKWLP
jgi:hypothetical protein